MNNILSQEGNIFEKSSNINFLDIFSTRKWDYGIMQLFWLEASYIIHVAYQNLFEEYYIIVMNLTNDLT